VTPPPGTSPTGTGSKDVTAAGGEHGLNGTSQMTPGGVMLQPTLPASYAP
jgi:hypothetical protein